MKNPHTAKPARSPVSVLHQLCKFIPGHLVHSLAASTGVQACSRTFSPWSHVVAMLFAQLTHAVGLNDVSDSLGLRRGQLASVRGATPPARNTLSHANKIRPAEFMEQLFWGVLAYLQSLTPEFARGPQRAQAHRFKAPIHVVDTTTIALVANCLDWAKHRRRKAAAKCHLRLNLRSQLPQMVVIDTANEGDNRRARELCAGVLAGEIVLFDKAYLDWPHLFDLAQRGVSWVTRAKDNLAYRVVRRRQRQPAGPILRDDEIVLTVPSSRAAFPQRLRRVEALVEVQGEQRVMVFLTNNLAWQPSSVAELYRCRWQIEAFFKQIKQTLQLCDFLGNSANAVRWQVWSALLAYVLLRFVAWQGRWASSFSRLWALIRSALWDRLEVRSLLESRGTASGHFRFIAQPEQLWFPGLQRQPMG